MEMNHLCELVMVSTGLAVRQLGPARDANHDLYSDAWMARILTSVTVPIALVEDCDCPRRPLAIPTPLLATY
jgi:hypothetical protein